MSTYNNIVLNKEQIKARLQHREPFLLIDEVVEFVEGKRCTAIKHVTKDEFFFKGHFPDFPVMPGVLILEALAQTAAVIYPVSDTELTMYTGIDKAKFKAPVFPGDDLILKAEFGTKKSFIAQIIAQAFVKSPGTPEKLAARGILTVGIVSREHAKKD